MTGMTYGIVAGYDGSPGSAQAVRWAAREALARGTTLTVCLAWRPDHMELAARVGYLGASRAGWQEDPRLRAAVCRVGAGARPGARRARWRVRPLRCCASAAAPPRWSWSAPAGTASCPACGWDRFPGR